jgi:dTDP-4-amino-4,6-dideoxygalactose transaminase
MRVPLCDLTEQYVSLKPQIDAAIQEVLASGHYILGPNVRAFEQEIADYLGCKYAVGVNSGTDALHLALRALNIGPGDEVITTPFTFVATTEAIGMVGATPVFVDIDPYTYNIDPRRIEPAITPRTKAILPVHLYGQPCDMDAIMAIAQANSLHVVEDCAQALGAAYRQQKTGTFGAAGCLSFFPSKNLGCFGDGGMVATDDENIFHRVEMLRRHGGRVKYHHDELGLNSRLDELQAAVLRVKLSKLDLWNGARRERAYRYNRLLASTPGIELPRELQAEKCEAPTGGSGSSLCNKSVYQQYTILVDDRDSLAKRLQERGIGCFSYYPVPLHLQRVHKELGYGPGRFPVAERVAERCLSLPMFPELSEAQQDEVVRAIEAIANLPREGHQAAERAERPRLHFDLAPTP